MTESGKAFVPFGVTYYRPGTGWAPQVWKQFDAEATRRDFSRMKELGVNCVRVFLSFGSFYHASGVLDTNGLAKFDQFLMIAEAAGIYVHPTGPDLWEGPPEWTLGGIEDEKTLSELEKFWKLFAARYRGRNVIFAYDLRNEPAVGWDGLEGAWNSWLAEKYQTVQKLNAAWRGQEGEVAFGSIAVPPKKDAPGERRLLVFQYFREHLADEWTRRQAVALRGADANALVTVGLVQWSVPSLLPGDLSTYSAFRPERQARYIDFLEVHFYPLLDGGYRYKDPESETRNLGYLESVVRAAAQPGKPLVLAEFGWYGGGTPHFNAGAFPVATEARQAQYNRRVIETSAGLACGWLNWGFYDSPQATDCSELTGLLTADGKIKAWGGAFKDLAAKLQAKPVARKAPGARPALNWDACLTSIKSQQEFLKQYLKACAQGLSE
jgi:endo-1,4-beta-mannosidase